MNTQESTDISRISASRFVLLYHMKKVLRLLTVDNITEASLILNAAIAVADDEDRAALLWLIAVLAMIATYKVMQ